MRTLSGEEWARLYTADTKLHTQFVVQGVRLADVLSTGVDPLLKADLIADLDEVAERGTFTFRLGKGADSLSPYLTTGLQIDGAPALSEDRAVRWNIQQTAPGVAPSFFGWRQVFEGVIDTVSVSPASGTVTVNCRGRAAALLGTEIENITDNGDGIMQWGFPVTSVADIEAATNILLQDCIQFILDTAYQYAYGNPFPDPFEVLDTPPTNTATAFWQQRTNLMQAIRDIGTAKGNGWDLRYRWDLPTHGIDSFTLAYYLPDRLGGGTITPIQKSRTGGLVYANITSLNLDIVGIRNVAEVTPADEARVPVVTVNTASTARVGRRFEAVSEDLANHIDTPAEAGDLGLLIVTDGGSAKTAIELALPFTWCFELNDLFTVGPDDYCFDRADLVFAVTHYELHYAKGVGSTVLAGRQAGAAAQWKAWRDLSVNKKPKGVYARTIPPVGPAKEDTFWAQYDVV